MKEEILQDRELRETVTRKPDGQPLVGYAMIITSLCLCVYFMLLSVQVCLYNLV